MPQAQEIIKRIAAHFSRYRRPDNFINRHHCCECEEHYQELLNVPVEAISYSHVENQGWDPTCFLSPDAFRYYFPGLVQIADEHKEDWLNVLTSRMGLHYTQTFNPEDCALVRQLLEYWWLCEDVSEWDRSNIGRVLENWYKDA